MLSFDFIEKRQHANKAKKIFKQTIVKRRKKAKLRSGTTAEFFLLHEKFSLRKFLFDQSSRPAGEFTEQILVDLTESIDERRVVR